MSTASNDGGLVDVFVKGVVFALGAATVGLLLRRVTRKEPEVVVVTLAPDSLDDADSLDEADSQAEPEREPCGCQ